MAFNGKDTIPLWLNGKEVTTSTTYDVKSPLDSKVLYKASAASVQDVESAVKAAAEAFKSWSKAKPATRRDIFLKAADVVSKRKDEFFGYDNKETGAIDSMFGFDIGLAIDGLKAMAGLISAVRGDVITPSDEGKSAMMVREPFGVVLSIAPWNAPYVLGFRSVIGPLAMGNTVVLKGAEASPGCYWAIASALHEAGLPAGCLNTVINRPQDASEITTSLIANPAIKKINFTGSTNVGAIIASLAGKYLKPTVMELGGKAPTIVCEDANIEQAALGAALGAFLHAGQICMATERVLVNAKVADKFKEVFPKMIDQVFGAPDGLISVSELGPAKNKKLVEDALSKGAKVIHGDAKHNSDNKHAMKPLVLSDVSEKMDIYYTESFGPTVSVFIVQNDEEAIKIANDTDYGLASAVFTEDLRRGLKIARQIETGAVHINSMSIHDEALLPHGGAKKSGFGRFNSREGLEEWVRTKVITWQD